VNVRYDNDENEVHGGYGFFILEKMDSLPSDILDLIFTLQRTNDDKYLGDRDWQTNPSVLTPIETTPHLDKGISLRIGPDIVDQLEMNRTYILELQEPASGWKEDDVFKIETGIKYSQNPVLQKQSVIPEPPAPPKPPPQSSDPGSPTDTGDDQSAVTGNDTNTIGGNGDNTKVIGDNGGDIDTNDNHAAVIPSDNPDTKNGNGDNRPLDMPPVEPPPPVERPPLSDRNKTLLFVSLVLLLLLGIGAAIAFFMFSSDSGSGDPTEIICGREMQGSPVTMARDFLSGTVDASIGMCLAQELRSRENGLDAVFLLLEDAASKGNPQAMFELAVFYDPLNTAPTGTIQKDPLMAWQWYSRAAGAGEASAAEKLAALRTWAEEEAAKGSAAARDLLNRR